MARSLVASDNFNRGDGALGVDWASLNSGSGNPVILSQKVVASHVQHVAARWVGSGSWTADQYAKCTALNISVQGPSVGVGVIVRASADTEGSRDYYAALVNGNNALPTLIIKVVDGIETTLSSVTGDGWASGDTIALEAEGTTLRVYRNDVLLRSVTDSSIAGSTSDRAGIILVTTTFEADDWEGGNVTSSALKYWRVPTSAANSTVREMLIMSNDRATVEDKGNATAQDGSFKFQCTSQALSVGTKRIALMNNWDGSTSTTSIRGGPAIAEVVEE